MTSDLSGGDPALLSALEAVLREQALVERELAERHARLAYLREASSGLIGLIGAAEAERLAAELGVALRRRPTARPVDEQRRSRNERVHQVSDGGRDLRESESHRPRPAPVEVFRRSAVDVVVAPVTHAT